MDGVGGVPGAALRILGRKAAGLVLGTGGFRPNGTGSITVFRGSLAGQFTVTYSATGLYAVAFTPTGFKFPTDRLPIIRLAEQMVDVTNTNRFRAVRKGAWSNTTRGFTIAALQESSAFAVPSDAENWIDFVIYGETK